MKDKEDIKTQGLSYLGTFIGSISFIGLTYLFNYNRNRERLIDLKHKYGWGKVMNTNFIKVNRSPVTYKNNLPDFLTQLTNHTSDIVTISPYPPLYVYCAIESIINNPISLSDKGLMLNPSISPSSSQY